MLPRRPLRQGPPGLMRKGEETEEAAASLHLHASPSLGLYRPRVDVSLWEAWRVRDPGTGLVYTLK